MTTKSSSKGSGSRVWKFFSSVKLSVVVLLLLAATSVIGTLIPQNADPAFYFQKYGEVFYRLFTVLDIVDMYHSWWFLVLVGFLAVNIVVCSIDRLSSTWTIIFSKTVSFNPERFRKLKDRQVFETIGVMGDRIRVCETVLKKQVGTVIRKETESGVALYAESGRKSRLGVYVVHLSILLLLAGAVIGSIWGFKGFVTIPEGGIVDTVAAGEGGKEIPIGFSVRCNDFHVSFYDTGAPEEFRSNLTLIENGKEVLTTDIRVNSPLRYKGINLYQSSYGTDSASDVVLTITSAASGMVYKQTLSPGETVDMPENGGRFTLEQMAQGYNFRGHNLGESLIGMQIDAKGNEIEVVMPVRFPTFDKMRRGDFAFEVESYEKKYFTGLQVTKDPGVWYVYTGFLFMIAGCWVTFFMSHQSVCVEVEKSGKNGQDIRVSVAGTANRNRQSMKLKVARLSEKMKDVS
ncbi:MAG: cytochrome c biogenesis protein ResB [Pseudomonadota bacterium]